MNDEQTSAMAQIDAVMHNNREILKLMVLDIRKHRARQREMGEEPLDLAGTAGYLANRLEEGATQGVIITLLAQMIAEQALAEEMREQDAAMPVDPFPLREADPSRRPCGCDWPSAPCGDVLHGTEA